VEPEISMPLGVVVEKRKASSPWIDWVWKPVGILPGAGPRDDWLEIAAGEGWTHYHAATLPLSLHHTDTEAYVINLSDKQPSIYTVLRDKEDGNTEQPYRVYMVTASPFEAQDLEDSGEDIVERIAMSDGLIAWVREFVDAHHIEEPFKKRKRHDIRDEPEKFGKEPIFGKTRQPDSRGTSGDQ
jgi:uncharacterized protein DUF3305